MKLKYIIVLLLLFISNISFSQLYTEKPTDKATSDAFSRLRVSNPQGLTRNQFTYDRRPLDFDTITVGAGSVITYESTDRLVNMSFTAAATNDVVAMQSFEHYIYQEGKSQLAMITFNMNGGDANAVKFAGYSDGTNGVEFIMNVTTPTVRILSGTGNGNQTVAQGSWNIDALDGTGSSGITFDPNDVQILVIDLQALYVGSVRIGFSIGGKIYYVHQFDHSNQINSPYIQTANLPIRVGMTATGTATTDIDFICSTVISEGGQEDPYGIIMTAEGTVTAASGADTHILSIEPKTTFNSITNRTVIGVISVDLLVTGSNPVKYKVVTGQALSGSSTSDVNTTYSSMETVSGTLSGSPLMVIDRGYVPASNQAEGSIFKQQTIKLPITLRHDGTKRSDNSARVSVLVQGEGGPSVTHATLKWQEIR